MLSWGDGVRMYPDFIVRKICGGKVVRTVVQRIWSFVFGGTQYDLQDGDYAIVERIAERVTQEFIHGHGLSAPFSIDEILKIRAYAEKCVMEEAPDKAVRVLFIVDDSLAALRRHIIPAEAVTHVARGKVIVDCATVLDFQFALSYDIIMVRQISPQDYITLSRLQYVGKIVVFDIDEPLFDIPSHHPKALTFTPLNVELHRSLLLTADFIAVRRMELLKELGLPTGTDHPQAAVLEDMVEVGRILPSPPTCSPARFDIVCFADEGQQGDIDLIDEAVWECLQKMPTAHVTFVGCVPTQIQARLEPLDRGATAIAPISQVHTLPFPAPSDYYTLLSHIPMDIALVPRLTNDYNARGSDVPIMELLAKGVPVLASMVGGSTLFDSSLVLPMRSIEDWADAMLSAYNSRQDPTVNTARLAEVYARFDVAGRARDWAGVFQNIVGKE